MRRRRRFRLSLPATATLLMVAASLLLPAASSAAINLSLAGCPSDTAGVTQFGNVAHGTAVVLGDCVIGFGSDSDTSMLRLHQADAGGAAMQRVPGGGIVGYWPLNGSGANVTPAPDPTGLATVLDAPAQDPAWGAGAAGAGSALVFDGDDRASIAYHAAFQPTATTVDLRVRIDSNAAGANAMLAGIDDGCSSGWSLRLDTSTQSLVARMGTGGCGNAAAQASTGAGDIMDGQWHHVALTTDWSVSPYQLRLYVDGALRSSASTTAGRATPALPIQLGARDTNAASYLTGAIDELRIWNVVRSAAQVRSMASAGIADYAFGSADWDQGPSTFGACLKGVAGPGVVGSWTVDPGGACTAVDTDPWNPIAQASAPAGAKIAASTTSGTTSGTATIQFGARVGSSIPDGRFVAPLVVEVIAPDV